MQRDMLSSQQEHSGIRSLITQLSEKINQISQAEREAVSADLNALKALLQDPLPVEPDLRRNEARYRSLFEQMSEGFALHEMIFDDSGTPVDYRFLEINPAFERLTGLKREDVVGRLKTEVLPGDTSNWIEIYGRVTQTGESIRFENYSTALKQHYEVFAYRPAPCQFATLFINITERKQIEHEAQEGKRLLDVLLEYVPEGITIADAPDAHIRTVSKYGLEKLGGEHRGLTLAEVTNQWEVRHPDGATEMAVEEQPLMRAIQKGETVRDVEISVLNSSGKRLSLLCNAAPILGEDNEITGGIVAWHDITERRRDEAVLRENEAMLHGLFEAETIYAAITELEEDDIRFLRTNLRLAAFYGRTPAEMAGASQRELGVSDAEMMYWLEVYRRCLSDGIPVSVEFPFTFDNQQRWYMGTLSLIDSDPARRPQFAFVTIDITDRKQAEEALRLSEERFRLAGMAVTGIVYDLDIARNQVYRSSRLKDLLGYDPSEVPPKREWWKTLIHPDDLERVEQHDRQVADSRAIQSTCEYRVQHKDGHYLTVLDNAFIIRDENGKPVRHVGSNTDITARKQMEEKLRLSEQRFRLASRAVQGIVYDWDLENNTVFRSEGMEQVIGYLPQEVPLGNTWWQERIHPDDVGHQLQFLEMVFAGKDETYQTEYRVQHKDGHWVHLLDRSFITRDESGKAIRMIGSSNDISARKRYEATLLEAQKREQNKVQELEAILDATPAFVWIAHDPQCRMMTGNRAAYEAVRMRPGENISKSAPPGEGPTHFVAMKNGKEIPTEELPVQMAAAKGIAVRDYEFDFVFSNGEVMCLIGNAHPLFDEDGNPRGAVSAFLDITERKRIENALRESEAHFALTLENTSIFLFNQDDALRYTWRHNPEPIFNDDTIGKTDYDFYCVEEADMLTALKRRVIETGQRLHEEVTLHIEGQAKIFDIILGPLCGENGEVIGITGAATDITQMRLLEQQQFEQKTQIEVQRRLQEYRERERREIARDIHDGPIQTLMSVLIDVQLTKEVINNSAIQLDLESISATVRSAVHELRDVVNQLRPPALIRFGLARSLSIHAEDFRDKHPGMEVDLELPPKDVQMSEELILTMFRIYQEALNNITRHAKAQTLRVRYALDKERAVLEIQDDGVGFYPPSDLLLQTQLGHYGLAGMKERAETVGGDFQVKSKPGGGTTIRVTAPLSRA
jgi:PAS domain S-box-containing protein